MRPQPAFLFELPLLLLALLLSGCATSRHAPPAGCVYNAQVYGMHEIRAFSGIPSNTFKDDFVTLIEHEKETHKTYSMLALSGGGANGAYGAGLLCGWTQAGTRPTFKVVTGISTGAIIAPFAFLGSSYDTPLKEFYTTYSTKDLITLRVPFKESLASMRPLERTIEKYFTPSLLADVATAYHNGQRLYVGTTDLDEQRLVIWDMGKIAAQGTPESLALFRKVVFASASIPIVSAPVYIDIQVNNETYQEMHVDGGVTKQVFFLYDVLHGFTRALREKGIAPSSNQYAIYVVRNGYVDPTYQAVPTKISAITGRTLDSIINNQSIGDLYQLYTFTKAYEADFNLAYIPASHISRAKQPFDPAEMKVLFDLGYQSAIGGYPWQKSPPGFENPTAVAK